MAETYGGDLSRWPREVVSAAAKTLHGDPEAARLLQEALELDNALQEGLSETIITASSQLRERLLAIPQDLSLPAPLAWLAAPRHFAAGLSLFLVLGIFIGTTDLVQWPDSQIRTTAWILAPDQVMVGY